jgi:hypothetical protein
MRHKIKKVAWSCISGDAIILYKQCTIGLYLSDILASSLLEQRGQSMKKSEMESFLEHVSWRVTNIFSLQQTFFRWKWIVSLLINPIHQHLDILHFIPTLLMIFSILFYRSELFVAKIDSFSFDFIITNLIRFSFLSSSMHNILLFNDRNSLNQQIIKQELVGAAARLPSQ